MDHVACRCGCTEENPRRCFDIVEEHRIVEFVSLGAKLYAYKMSDGTLFLHRNGRRIRLTGRRDITVEAMRDMLLENN